MAKQTRWDPYERNIVNNYPGKSGKRYFIVEVEKEGARRKGKALAQKSTEQ